MAREMHDGMDQFGDETSGGEGGVDVLDVADFVVAAFVDEERWVTVGLPVETGADLESMLGAARRLPAESGVVMLAAFDDDFFLILRVQGARVRALLSDASASLDWAIADEVLTLLDLPEVDEEEPEAAGDLQLLADLGVPALALEALCEDDDLYPDEVLTEVARRLGLSDYSRAVATSRRS
ncbi:MAG: tRNA adenosine deaminase-associated protein [Actinomycetes bacterium]